jgi:hypothetical protein
MALAEENDDKSPKYNFICRGSSHHQFQLEKIRYPKDDFEEISGQEYWKLKN